MISRLWHLTEAARDSKPVVMVLLFNRYFSLKVDCLAVEERCRFDIRHRLKNQPLNSSFCCERPIWGEIILLCLLFLTPQCFPLPSHYVFPFTGRHKQLPVSFSFPAARLLFHGQLCLGVLAEMLSISVFLFSLWEVGFSEASLEARSLFVAGAVFRRTSPFQRLKAANLAASPF